MTQRSPKELAAWYAQPRPPLTLSQLEAWLATDHPSIPDHGNATCPTCNGWGDEPTGALCGLCRGARVVPVGVWRRELRARIEAATS